MLVFTVEHKYCKSIRVVEGVNVYDAFKSNNGQGQLFYFYSIIGHLKNSFLGDSCFAYMFFYVSTRKK
jgi:hypothetical protein